MVFWYGYIVRCRGITQEVYKMHRTDGDTVHIVSHQYKMHRMEGDTVHTVSHQYKMHRMEGDTVHTVSHQMTYLKALVSAVKFNTETVE